MADKSWHGYKMKKGFWGFGIDVFPGGIGFTFLTWHFGYWSYR